MKKIFVSILFLSFGVLVAHAQDLETILEKHYKAMGFENVDKIKTLKIKANTSAMGMETPLKMYIKVPSKSRVEVEVMGKKMVQGYDGAQAWMTNPMTGQIMEAPEAQRKQMASNAQIEGVLWNYKEKGNKVAYEGKVTVDNQEYYKLKVTTKEGENLNALIDTKDYLLDIAQSDMQGANVNIYFEDYRPVEGVQMFHKMFVKSGGDSQMTMTYEEVKVNEKLEDTLFSMPE